MGDQANNHHFGWDECDEGSGYRFVGGRRSAGVHDPSPVITTDFGDVNDLALAAVDVSAMLAALPAPVVAWFGQKPPTVRERYRVALRRDMGLPV